MPLTLDITFGKSPPSHCPACHVVLDHAMVGSTEGKRGPRGGDLTICTECFAYLVFLENLQLRLLPDSEWLRLPVEQRAFYTGCRNMVKFQRTGKVD